MFESVWAAVTSSQSLAGLLVALCLVACATPALATPANHALVTTGAAEPVDVSGYLYVLSPAHTDANADDSRPPDGNWQLFDQQLLLAANSVYWLRFNIVNSHQDAQGYQLRVAPFLLKEMRVSSNTAGDNGNPSTILSFARNQNEIGAGTGRFQLSAGQSTSIYLRISTDIASPINIELSRQYESTPALKQANSIWYKLSGVLWALLFIVFTAAILTRRAEFAWLFVYAIQSTALATSFLPNHLPLPPATAETLLKTSLILGTSAPLSYIAVLKHLFGDKPWPRPLGGTTIIAAIVVWTIVGSFLGIPALLLACKLAVCTILVFALLNAAHHFDIRQAELIWVPLGFRCLVLLITYLLYAEVANGAISFSDFELVFSALLISEITLLIFVFARLYRQRREQQLSVMLQAARREQQVATIAPLLSPTRHDLRSPLSDIIGLSELVLDGPLDQQQRRYLGQVQLTARKALEAINALFSYQHNEATRPQIEPFILNNLLAECAQYYAQPCNASGREIILHCTDTPADSWLGDHVKLRQALMHCIEMFLAIEHARQLYIETRTRDAALEILLNIDAGDYHAAEQFAETTFSSVRNLIESTGGHVEIALKDNDIAITLAPRLQHVTRDDPATDNRVIKGKRILLADDNPTTRQVIRTYLEPWGAIVEDAATQTEALAHLRQKAQEDAHFDLMLLDFLMPDGNGIELAKAIALEEDIAGKTTIIVMSNAANLISIEQAKNFGIRRILEKPVVPETLKLALHEELNFQHALAMGQLEKSNAIPAGRDDSAYVLLVEDNPISAKVVRAMLDRSGLAHQHVSSAASALSKFTSEAFDIVILDCKLPDLDGFTLCGKLREIEQIRHSKTPAYIVALTAYDDQSSKSLADDAGMDQFVSKPMNMRQLESIIDSARRRSTP